MTASTFSYGDPVLYDQNGILIPANVLQSQIVTVPDSKAPGGVREEEHLTIAYLNPKLKAPLMTQVQMDAAILRAYGVQERSDTQLVGYIRAFLFTGSRYAVDWDQAQGRRQGKYVSGNQEAEQPQLAVPVPA
jgi:hypothetical protein